MDPRVELSLIDKHVRQHNNDVGETVLWFEFRPFASAASAGSVYDDVYDEGVPGVGGRDYLPGKTVRTIYVEEMEDQFTAQEDGRQPTQNLSVTVLYKDMAAAGVSSPAEYRGHLNDIIFYDQRYYKINDYHVRGRLPGEVVIGVRGYEVYIDQEFPFDDGPPPVVSLESYWPSTFPQV